MVRRSDGGMFEWLAHVATTSWFIFKGVGFPAEAKSQEVV